MPEHHTPEREAQLQPQVVTIPTPDPTSRTLEQAEKGLACLRELIEARLDGMDKISALMQDNLSHLQEVIDKTVGHLKVLQDEQFKGIDVRFTERDTRTDKTAELNQKAIDAALQAAEKAVGKQQEAFTAATNKTEAAFTKQIDAMSLSIQTGTKVMDDKINDIKTRLTTMDGRGSGMASVWGFIVGGLGLVTGVISVVVLLVRN